MNWVVLVIVKSCILEKALNIHHTVYKYIFQDHEVWKTIPHSHNVKVFKSITLEQSKYFFGIVNISGQKESLTQTQIISLQNYVAKI